MRFAVAIIAVAVLVSSASAQVVVNPRVKINNSLDTSSAAEVVAQIIKPGMTDEQKALACWRFMLDHFYHWFPPYEDSSPEPVRDFAKAINSYGFSPCFGNGPVLTDLWEAAGLKTRSWTVTGHAIPEVFYGNAWHMIDADARAWHRKADGQIASVEELANDPKLFTEPKEKSDPYYPFGAPDVAVAPLIPWGPPATMMSLYASKRDNYRYNKRAVAGHAMYLALRPGETLTLSPENVGKWFKFIKLPKDMTWTNARVAGGEKITTVFDNGPASIDGKFTYGNGTLVWQPDLKTISQDELLWLGSENVQLKDGKLSPADASKPMVAVFRTYCPWVVIDTQVTVNTIGATPAPSPEVEVSVDGGYAWFSPTAIQTAQGLGWNVTSYMPASLPGSSPELAKPVSLAGNYEFLTRVTLDKGAIDAVKFETTFQVSQFVLPRLVPGRNFIKVYRGPDEGVVQLVLSGNKAAKERYIVEQKGLRANKNLAAETKEQPATVVYKLTAPNDLVAISMGGLCSISRGPIPFVQGEYSFDSGKTWTQAFKIEKNTNNDNTTFEEDVKVAVPEAVKTREALFRYTIAGDYEHKGGKPAGTLESIRLYAYYRLPQPAGAKLDFSLAWQEKVGDQWLDKSYSATLDKLPADLMPDLGGEQVKLKSITFRNSGK